MLVPVSADQRLTVALVRYPDKRVVVIDAVLQTFDRASARWRTDVLVQRQHVQLVEATQDESSDPPSG
ncbi:MAG: hypothetical protein H7Y32_04125 [Chloroflexales bacterium]|nr:hypothetical protein [Chloroflexales bacterium]